jgi:DUF438 domain-containing protein
MNEKRIENLTSLLKKLNENGVSEELRKEALDIVLNIDPMELSIAEQRLIENGMNPHDLRHLCDIHMEVLKDELYKLKAIIEPGHLVSTLIAEHERINQFLTELEDINADIQKLDSFNRDNELFNRLLANTNNLLDAENHHKREEDVLFMELEKRNITGPPRIMRMEHDELRLRKRLLKEAAESIDDSNFEEAKAKIDEYSKYIIFNLRDHIYKENYILYPTAVDAIKESELWADMKIRCDKIGYCSFTPEM